MALNLENFPKDVQLLDQILEKTLSNGMLVEVYLTKTPRQFEAALFVEGRYKPGPPIPRPMENPTDQVAYWMGVRPRVGFSQEEGDEILGAVNVQNKVHHCLFVDKWGSDTD